MNMSERKEPFMSSGVNVAIVEGWASALGGAALTAHGIKQLKARTPAGAMLAAAGTVLIYRGATGHCAMYEVAGVDTARTDTRRALSGSRFGILNSEFGIDDRVSRIPNSEFQIAARSVSVVSFEGAQSDRLCQPLRA
ncbi:MAG: hypothetical protein DMF98_10780 [Acidobacteria bacterium]|nr:MAG: hypothetical protein DMF98_10780 [Acidobacteriota bacterium]